MKTYLVIAFGLFAATVYWPQNSFSLTGKIIDDVGDPMIGATVKAFKDDTLFRSTLSDINGAYRLALDPGIYDIEVCYTGYQTFKTKGIRIAENKEATLNVQLKSFPPFTEPVMIVPPAAPPKLPGGQALTAEEVRTLPSRSPDGMAAPEASTDEDAFKVKGARSEAAHSYPNHMDTEVPPVYLYLDGDKESDLMYQNAPVSTAAAAKPAPQTAKSKKAPRDYSIPKDEKIAGKARRKCGTPPKPDNPVEHYAAIRENPFLEAKSNAVSTFSIDVDAASYSNARRFLQAGQLPPADAVRIEEFINYFDYQYPTPKGAEPFSINTELAECPWAPKHQLLMVGLQGRPVETGQLPPSNFVFLVDVSGSMNEPNKLPLVQQSLAMLTDYLRPQDRVALVVYAGAAGLVLPSTPGSDKTAIKTAIERLSAGGSTAGADGIQLAYQTARNHFVRGGNNRVVLCTDGDFNVGVSSDEELVKLIEKERESGIFLTVLGFGTGNYQDSKMQQLADKGNGNHGYIDQIGEAKKMLVTEFGGTLFAIAKDVKIQVEFNPARVAGYRLIGYENRLLAREDFDDDTKDAGELGSGHRVTALYEIVPIGQPLPTGIENGEMRYQQTALTPAAASGELCSLKLRYKAPKAGAASQLIETTVANRENPTPCANFQLAAAVAEFGLLLRNSTYKSAASYENALNLAQQAAKTDMSGYRKELCELLQKARVLAGTETARR